MYCHILYKNEFTYKYTQGIKRYFNLGDHLLIIIGTSPSLRRDLIYENSIESATLQELEVRKALDECRHIFFHSLHIPEYLASRIELLRKASWILWGADLYKAVHGIYENPAGSPEPALLAAERVRRFVIGHLYSIIGLKEDYDIVLKYYDTKARYFFGNYPALADLDLLDRSLAAAPAKEFTTFLVGNSATNTNNHVRILHLLKRFRDEAIEVVVPLSYGDRNYAEQVTQTGREIFGDKFVPLFEFLPFDRYAELLARTDIAVFDHNRQQAAGTIWPLLYLGKTIFQQLDNTLSQSFASKGITIRDIEELGQVPFSRLTGMLTDEERQRNRQLAQEYLSDYAWQIHWKRIFEHLEGVGNSCAALFDDKLAYSPRESASPHSGLQHACFRIRYSLSPYISGALGGYDIYGRIIDYSSYTTIGDGKPKDAHDICYTERNGTLHYHPVMMTQYGLLHIDGYLKSNNPHHLDMAERYARKLIETAHCIQDAFFFPYTFDFPLHGNQLDTLKADWYSAMAQGQALSLFSLLFSVTGKADYLEDARRTFRSFSYTKGTHEPWIVEDDASEGVWLEEYPGERPCAALNGFIYALFGLYDYCSVERTAESEGKLQAALIAAKSNVAKFRNPGGISYYCTTHRVTNAGYHNIHIMQLIHLWKITDDGYFRNVAERFHRDHDGFGVPFEQLCTPTVPRVSAPAQERTPTSAGHEKTQPLKILMVHQNPCIRVLKEAQALRRLGHRVELLVEKCTNKSFRQVTDNIYFFTDEPSFAFLVGNAGPWDIIHCHNEPNFVTAMAIRHANGTPVVYDCHDLTGLRESLDTRETALEAYCFEHCDAVVHVSDSMDATSRDMYRVDRSLVLPSFPTISDISFTPKQKLPGHHIVYEGGLLDPGHFPWEYRNYLSIFFALVNEGIHVHAYAAQKDRSALRTYYRLAERNPYFHLHDTVPYQQLVSEMSAYTWGLAGFNFEEVTDERKKVFLNNALPNKLFDYLLAGVCPIVYNCDTAGEYATRLDAGYHASSVADIISIIRNGRPKPPLPSLAAISMESQIKNLVSLYRELIHTRCHRHSPVPLPGDRPAMAAEMLRERFWAAERCASTGDLAGAEALFREISAALPSHIGAKRALGSIAEQQGQLVAAVQHYLDICRAYPLDKQTLVSLHGVLRTFGKQHDMGELVENYLQTAGEDPDIAALR